MFKSALRHSCLALLLLATPAWAEDAAKPDDVITFTLSAEGWAVTNSARVTVTVDAAVAGAAATGLRGDMQKAVNGLAKSDWRLTSFNRSQDNTGLERWNASFVARIPENELGGIHDAAKKASKAGMQLSVNDIAFDPTLAEIEATKAKLRADLTKQASEQLATLNSSLPGRYRLGALHFSNGGFAQPVPQPMMMQAKMMASADMAMASNEASMERGEKITQQVQVIYAATPLGMNK